MTYSANCCLGHREKLEMRSLVTYRRLTLGNTLLQTLHKHSAGRTREHMDVHSLHEVKGQQVKV